MSQDTKDAVNKILTEVFRKEQTQKNFGTICYLNEYIRTTAFWYWAIIFNDEEQKVPGKPGYTL